MGLKIPKEERLRILNNIKNYFFKERGEEIGDLAAEFLLDFMVAQLGPAIYNQAVSDVQIVLSGKLASLEEDLYALKVPLKYNDYNK